MTGLVQPCLAKITEGSSVTDDRTREEEEISHFPDITKVVCCWAREEETRGRPEDGTGPNLDPRYHIYSAQ